jgi:lipopolysaccharide biosynthesis protein
MSKSNLNSMNNQKIKVIDFDVLWRVIPMNRPEKEAIKTVLFTVFPFFFKHWAIYQNWSNAAVFRKTNHNILQVRWWQMRFSNQYKERIVGVRSENVKSSESSIAVIIHSFYPDILIEILNYLERSDLNNLKLYITTPEDKYDETKNILKLRAIEYRIFIVENLGRDILPFLHVLPEVIHNKHDIVLKLHTKKSNHLNRKDEWKDRLFENLIGHGRLQKAIQIFNNNPEIGAIAPTGNILTMRYNYGANADRVRSLAHSLGVEDAQLGDLSFIAGSMFYIKTVALLPLMALNISEADFETEAGQTDGTMAHVIERLFVLSAKIASYQLADTDFDSNSPHFTVTKIHYFTH